jgi:hypothetical protein
MSKLIRAGLAALVITGASIFATAPASFADPVRERLSATEQETLTDARIAIVKFALQLTPAQEKDWPAVEEAIRARASGRQARLASAQTRADEIRSGNAVEALRDRDPIDFLRRRADALAQRSAELKRLADAWQPLYQTLSPDQRKRLGLVAVLVFRDLRDRDEERLLNRDDDDDND